MTLFRLLLIAIIFTVGGYTMFVLADHGWNFLPPFFADIAEAGWPGQFNMDFSAMLILASLWLMWRHHFSGAGVLFGLIIFVGGAPFLCSYLLVASFKANGNVAELLLGQRRIVTPSSGVR
jgi:hypothetical protein